MFNLFKNFIDSLVFILPSRKSLNYFWNFGRLLGIVLFLQLFSGVFLVFYYRVGSPFESIQHIMLDVNYGWVFRLLHANGASFFFVFIYLHFFKGLFLGSFRLVKV